MKEPGILNIGELQAFAGICRFSRFHKDPEIRLCAFFRELVLTDPGSAGHLPVDEDIAVVHLREHVIEDRGQFFPCIRNLDPEKARTVEKAVEMFF